MAEESTDVPPSDDELDDLHIELPKRERDESLADYLMRRSDDITRQTDAQLHQVNNWLSANPQQPQRIWSLIARLTATLHKEIDERTIMLADEQVKARIGRGLIFGR